MYYKYKEEFLEKSNNNDNILHLYIRPVNPYFKRV